MIRYPLVRSVAAVARLQFELYSVGGSTTIGGTHFSHHISGPGQYLRIALHVPGEISALPVTTVHRAPTAIVGIRCTACQVTCSHSQKDDVNILYTCVRMCIMHVSVRTRVKSPDMMLKKVFCCKHIMIRRMLYTYKPIL
jgi:hypothetical protein